MKSNYQVLTHTPERINVISTKLGATKGEQYGDGDLNKPMVMGKQGNMYIAPADAEIEGFLDNIDAGPTADGFIFGGVKRCGMGTRQKVIVEDAASVLDFVVAGTNEAVGVANALKLGVVKKSADVPAVHKWRIISFADNTESTVGGGVAVIEKL